MGDLPIDEKEIYARRYAEIETIADLRLVDLREDHAIRMGVPTDVAKSSRQSLGRAIMIRSQAAAPATSVARFDRPTVPITRPIDTLVITVRDRGSRLGQVIGALAARLPDVVDLKIFDVARTNPAPLSRYQHTLA
ncbi:hypothetical protein I7I49_24295 [Sinorhizobium meliloti]|uniref:hypothetical protein n=1 Tax=Rhizobium meliloti TaxID=382 RepID=UPI00237F035F|nr:hypothetical protein [Sinorhizobium meliloti]MDE3813304.1 hypothetical protein [Sinorhizobium meliloti]